MSEDCNLEKRINVVVIELMELSGNSRGTLGELLGSSWGGLGELLGNSWADLGELSGSCRGALGELLGRSWGALGLLGSSPRSRGAFGPLGELSGRSRGALGQYFFPLWQYFFPLGQYLFPLWQYFFPLWQYYGCLCGSTFSSPALPRRLSSAAPVRNFIPDPQILSVICDVAPRRSPGASPALSQALPQRSPGAPPTPLKCRTCAQLYSRPSNSLSHLRCRAAHLSSAVPLRRPWRANFSECAKKSARLCGEMRVHFYLLSPALSGACPALCPALPQRSPGAPSTPLKCRTCAQLYS